MKRHLLRITFAGISLLWLFGFVLPPLQATQQPLTSAANWQERLQALADPAASPALINFGNSSFTADAPDGNSFFLAKATTLVFTSASVVTAFLILQEQTQALQCICLLYVSIHAP